MKDISLHIMDIAQNSLRAKATEVRISVSEAPSEDRLAVTIEDNGCGMDTETLKKAGDPYFTSRTTRRVGLGLPLLKMNAEQAGGFMDITSEKGRGTTVSAVFSFNNIDRPPLGDLAGTAALLITANPAVNIIYEHFAGNSSWSISTSEIRKELGDAAITDIQIVKYLKEIIRENISSLENIDSKHDKN